MFISLFDQSKTLESVTDVADVTHQLGRMHAAFGDAITSRQHLEQALAFFDAIPGSLRNDAISRKIDVIKSEMR